MDFDLKKIPKWYHYKFNYDTNEFAPYAKQHHECWTGRISLSGFNPPSDSDILTQIRLDFESKYTNPWKFVENIRNINSIRR